MRFVIVLPVHSHNFTDFYKKINAHSVSVGGSGRLGSCRP